MYAKSVLIYRPFTVSLELEESLIANASMIEQHFAELTGACLQLAENTLWLIQIGTNALIRGATSVGT